jgi:predicted neuraminidase
MRPLIKDPLIFPTIDRSFAILEPDPSVGKWFTKNTMKAIHAVCSMPFILLMPLVLTLACTRKKAANTVAVPVENTLGVISKGYIFDDDQPFAQCHASTIIRTGDDKFLVAWFAGTHEKHDDVGIWISKGLPGDWSVPIEIAKVRNDAHWNPVLFETPQGRIILFFKVGKVIDEWETWFMVSEDYGNTWTGASELVPGDKGGRGPVRNKPIVLSDGSWLAPASNENEDVWNAFTDRSEDQGRTWKATPYILVDRNLIPEEGVIQPTLWESSPGQVHMLLRSSSGSICRSDSEDHGRTWSPVYKTALPNNNSGIDLTQMDDGTLVLVYNPVAENWGPRTPISAAVSTDNGMTWSAPVIIESGGEDDEFSYPSVIHFGDTIAGTYTWKKQRIAIWMGIMKR